MNGHKICERSEHHEKSFAFFQKPRALGTG